MRSGGIADATGTMGVLKGGGLTGGGTGGGGNGFSFCSMGGR